MRMIGFNTDAISGSTALVDSIRQQLVELAQSGSITDAQLSSVQQKLATLADQALTSGGKAANIGLATDLNEFSRALGLLIELQQAQQQLRAVDPASQQQLNQLESFLQTLPQAMNAGAAGAERIAAAGAAFEDSVRRGVATLNVAPQGFAFGGAARGIDRIPAMLSPGEFVVNARSSRQFFSQLQAMNAGQQPIYRQDGGSVTNNIGDIVINTTTNQPGVMARDMMRAINRELRRGSGKL